MKKFRYGYCFLVILVFFFYKVFSFSNINNEYNRELI